MKTAILTFLITIVFFKVSVCQNIGDAERKIIAARLKNNGKYSGVPASFILPAGKTLSIRWAWWGSTAGKKVRINADLGQGNTPNIGEAEYHYGKESEGWAWENKTGHAISIQVWVWYRPHGEKDKLEPCPLKIEANANSFFVAADDVNSGWEKDEPQKWNYEEAVGEFKW